MIENDKRILLTGGGTAGHVTPNLAIIEELLKEGWQVSYIGTKNGIERALIAQKTNTPRVIPTVPYYAITAGKLRRFLSWRNLLMPLQFLMGTLQSYFLLGKIKPKVIFAKGGFVALPVVVAGWLRKIPVICHESDFNLGLANRLSLPFIKKICLSFAATLELLPKKYHQKAIITGTPLRRSLFQGDAARGRAFCGFDNSKKIMLVQGGGLGSVSVNQMVRALLPKLLPTLQIVHLCGKDKVDVAAAQPGYKQFAYLDAELPDVMAAADFVVSRAGANSLYELLALKKPHLLLPLSTKASRGDQLLNAKHFYDLGFSRVIFPEQLNETTLLNEIMALKNDCAKMRAKLAECRVANDAAERIVMLLAR